MHGPFQTNATVELIVSKHSRLNSGCNISNEIKLSIV